MSELTIEQRVAAGVAWLNENHPEWMSRVFVDSLDVSSCTLCVLGQVFGEYDDAPDEAKYDVALIEDDYSPGWSAPAKDRGFERYDGRFGEYQALTAEWRRVIESRRAES